MPLVHSFAPETTQYRGCPNAAIDPNFPPPFQSFGNNAEGVIFPSADASFAAAAEKPSSDVAVDSGGAGEEEGGHRSSMGPIPDIVPIAAVPSSNATSSSAEGFPIQRLEEQHLHHHHYEAENNHYNSYNANHHQSSTHQGLPSSGGDGDMVTDDQRGKEHLSNLAGEKGNLEENGRTHRIVR